MGRLVMRRRGFTLIEAVLTSVIIGLFAAGSVAFFAASKGPGADASARNDIVAILDSVVDYRASNGALPTSAFQLGHDAAGVVAVTSSTSTDLEASVQISESEVSVARIATSGSCWFAHMDMSYGAVSEVVVAVAEPGSVTTCSASNAPVAPSAGRGETWSEPIVLP